MTLTDGSSKFLSMNKKDSHRKIKRLKKSILNLLPYHQHQSNKHCKSLPSSNLPRSVTFASVFDDQILENENPSAESKDLIIIVPNKSILDAEPPVEPYPFRSEIPSCLMKKNSSSSLSTNEIRSERKTVDFLLPSHHRAKKLRHPLKITPIDRSKSTPNLFFPSSSISTDHHRSLKIIRHWFSSSSFGRFLQSFIKPYSSTKSTPSNYTDLIY